MNEWIYSTDNFSNQALVDFKIQSSHTEKASKNDAQNGHPCTEWFSSLYLQTNRKHMENHSLICTWKTLVYTDNITSTLTIVVFLINWPQMFALYVRQMCCKLELKTLNNWKRQHRFGITGNVMCVAIHAFALHSDTHFFFQQSFAWNLKNISPIVWYCCNIRRPYKISNILYKTNEKAVSFLSTTSRMSRDLSRVHSFSRPHGVSLFGNSKRCVVVSFSGATSVQWSVRFFRSLLRLFSSFPPIWVCEMKALKSGIFPRRRFQTCFLYLAEYSVKNFITTRQYLVNLMCNCWFRMCTQFHQKLISYKCILFVDCLVVWEYFVNWARVTKLYIFFLEVIFVVKVTSDVMFATQLLL